MSDLHQEQWDRLMKRLQGSMVEVRRASLQVVKDNVKNPGTDDVDAYEARAWAANDLLNILKGIHAPVEQTTLPVVEVGGIGFARKTCGAGMDGECYELGCPQRADGEPAKTGRFCPLPTGNAWIALRES